MLKTHSVFIIWLWILASNFRTQQLSMKYSHLRLQVNNIVAQIDYPIHLPKTYQARSVTQAFLMCLLFQEMLKGSLTSYNT